MDQTNLGFRFWIGELRLKCRLMDKILYLLGNSLIYVRDDHEENKTQI